MQIARVNSTAQPAAYTFPDPPKSKRWRAKWTEYNCGHALVITEPEYKRLTATLYVSGEIHIEAFGNLDAGFWAELQTFIAWGQQAFADYMAQCDHDWETTNYLRRVCRKCEQVQVAYLLEGEPEAES